MLITHKLHIRNKNLILDIERPELDYQKEVFINGITIKDSAGETVYQQTIENTAHYIAVLPETAILTDIHNQLIFIEISLTGTFGPKTPCGEDVMTQTFCTFDELSIFRYIIHKGKLGIDTCDYDYDLLNYMLRLKALEYAIISKDFKCALEIYNKFFGKRKKSCYSNLKPCGCHG